MSLQDKAKQLDEQFPTHKELFAFPTFESMGLKDPAQRADSSKKTLLSPVNYLCGNSLGLMPKSTVEAVNNELKAWAMRGVESHFRHPMESDGLTNWVNIDLPVIPLLAEIVGAKEQEVACMGTLTMNLNSLLCSFYQPTGSRYKILFEKHAFPSDYYAMLNQVKLHGYNEEALIQLAPRKGEFFLKTEDILETIENEGESIAVVCFSGIQYYTGQYFDIARITEAAHVKGCVVGWDLAHAVGNVDLQLHEWNVDFAAWCSYKYLNSGPGGIGGIFVHERLFHDQQWKPRLAGWWGNNSSVRFKMLEQFDPIPGALGFRQSNPSVIDVVSLRSSLETYKKCGGIKALREKSKALTKYLETLLENSIYYRDAEHSLDAKPHFNIITPSNPDSRGAQLSLLFAPHYQDSQKNVMQSIFKFLNERGVICDDRKPDVIRLAPVPSYNSFSDCYDSVKLLNEAFEQYAD
ncbi:hypothetical protein FOA43_002336 [Brettanomyces nanus]|uniref:Kynureninase n=1 Tax=Eeniella nana TaxID=13502 RepID=A0A875S0S1_EENNA|nr:uncharacterized protein FOA43_002336 [Brettanomyces nanus]QPG74996.1 hypothetical protein FOA43_002336 [Brettanomyces nanus]